MHHRRRTPALLFVLACLGVGPAVLADDIVHFQNGTYMKVEGYTVEGDTIKVTLGPGASMSFPRNLVESIERAGRTVYPQVGSGPANVVVSGSAGGQVTSSQYIQRGEDQIPARARAALGMGSGGGTAADKDEAAARPDPTSFQLSGNRAPLRAVGRRSGPIGEGLASKDPTAPPPEIQRPRVFPTIAPRGMSSSPTAPGPQATPPAEPPPPPPEPEPPQEDPPAEDDGGN